MIAQFDQVPNDSYAYGIVNIDDYLDDDELVDIVIDTLSKYEKMKNLNKTE